jgi:hypothetical protein
MNVKLTLGGKAYTLPPLTIEQLREISGRLHHGPVHDRDLDIVYAAWPKEGADLNAISATHSEIVAAAEQILAAAGLTRTRHDTARREREAADAN